MEQGQMPFPEIAPTLESSLPRTGRRPVIRFEPRPAGRPRREASRLEGDGLAARLRQDVERQLAHRRRMLDHLRAQGR
jgi:hypothetical protein